MVWGNDRLRFHTNNLSLLPYEKYKQLLIYVYHHVLYKTKHSVIPFIVSNTNNYHRDTFHCLKNKQLSPCLKHKQLSPIIENTIDTLENTLENTETVLVHHSFMWSSLCRIWLLKTNCAPMSEVRDSVVVCRSRSLCSRSRSICTATCHGGGRGWD